MLEFDAGDGIEVALGGGRSNFMALAETDPEYPDRHGNRRDGRDLIAEWRRRYPDGRYVWTQQQLSALDLTRTPRLFGLFEPDHMNYEHDRGKDRGGEPSLAQMTSAAISLLSRNRKGFLLVVEGGRIDHAHHAGNACRALTDPVAFSDAVRAASGETGATAWRVTRLDCLTPRSVTPTARATPAPATSRRRDPSSSRISFPVPRPPSAGPT